MELLVIAPRFPWPLEKGDKLRLYQQIRILSRSHQVHLFALSHHAVNASDLAALQPYCRTITLSCIPWYRLPWNILVGTLRGLPLSVSWFTDGPAFRALRRTLDAVRPDLVYAQLARTGEYLSIAPAPRVVDLMDAFSHIARQRAGIAPWWLRPFLRWEAVLLERYERRLAAMTDRQVFITERDRRMLDPEGRWPALVIPNGIDTAHFRPDPQITPTVDLVFVGNLGYFPNIAAAQYLVREVLPLVRASREETAVLLAGARPAPAVRALQGQGVRVEGWVEDIRSAYATGRIFVAPLFHGAGQQNKILEAMAMGIPVITTPHVHAGIGCPPEVVLLADSPGSFAGQILRLLQEPALRAEQSAAARRFVTEHHGWTPIVNLLDRQAFQPLIQKQ